jgi:hypothetical protein
MSCEVVSGILSILLAPRVIGIPHRTNLEKWSDLQQHRLTVILAPATQWCVRPLQMKLQRAFACLASHVEHGSIVLSRRRRLTRMSANKSALLLATLLSVLAARGLEPETLDPWRGWVAFKQFVRQVDEAPDPGVSVQINVLGDRRPVQLVFLRQILVADRTRFEPIGGIVCEFWFAPRRHTPSSFEAWSFDSPSFERFVDLVEQHPLFEDLLATRPLGSAIYWEDA